MLVRACGRVGPPACACRCAITCKEQFGWSLSCSRVGACAPACARVRLVPLVPCQRRLVGGDRRRDKGRAQARASAQLSVRCTSPDIIQGIPFIALEGEGEHSSFRLTDEAKEFLQTLKAPVALASIVGKYRTGKSLLVNRMLLDIKGGGAPCLCAHAACRACAAPSPPRCRRCSRQSSQCDKKIEVAEHSITGGRAP